MTIQDLQQFKDIHGRLIFQGKYGYKITLFGYIREVNQDHIIWQDNEKPDKFTIRNVISFLPLKLPTYL
jgi:hypothetical protein